MTKEKDVVEEALTKQIETEIDILNGMPPGEDKLNQAKVVSELTNSKKSWVSSLLEKKGVILSSLVGIGAVLTAGAKWYEVKARKDTNDKVLDVEKTDVVNSRAYINK